jgi:hypothetical protein
VTHIRIRISGALRDVGSIRCLDSAISNLTMDPIFGGVNVQVDPIWEAMVNTYLFFGGEV